MKIYRVDLDPTAAFWSAPANGPILVRAPTAAAARRYAVDVLSVRIANQRDMLLAVGEGAIEIETASGSGEGDNA